MAHLRSIKVMLMDSGPEADVSFGDLLRQPSTVLGAALLILLALMA